MANAIYPKYKEAVLGGSGDLVTADVKVILIDDADYTYAATHEFLTDVPAAARVDTSPNLTGKTVTNGFFDSDNIVFDAATGDQSEALLIYIDTGVEATSRLVAYIDANQTGLPVTPNGGDINYTVGTSWFGI